jgi:serine protease
MKALIYSLLIVVFSVSGCIDSGTPEESSIPDIQISYTGQLVARFTINFPENQTSNSQNPTESDLIWDFGDGYQSSGNGIDHQYLSPGEYKGKISYQKGNSLIEHNIEITFSGDNRNVIIQPIKNVTIDSDHNDPNQPFLSNNINPQLLSSPISLSGLLLNPNACQAGRLCDSGDTIDRYLLHLKYGDHIRIEIIKGAIDITLRSNTQVVNNTDPHVINGVISSHDKIISELNIPSNQLTEGQFELNINLNNTSNKAQYLIHIEPEEALAGRNYQPGKLIVVFKDSNSPQLIDISDPRLAHIDSDNSRLSLTEARSALAGQVEIKSVSYNYYRTAFSSNYWQWPLIKQDIDQLWSPLALRGQLPGSNTTIAILDTGLYLQHSNLNGLVTHSGYDFVSDPINSGDGNGWDSDPSDPGDHNLSYHGTHVTGIIAAQPQAQNTSAFIKGIAWGAEIMPLRVLGINGGTSYDLIQALRYAAGLPNDSHRLPEKPADIINLSLGGSQFSVAEQATIDEVIQSGAIVVAAAGNQGQEQVNYPAAYKDVIAVGATDINGEIAPYSNSGAFIDVVAPGGYCLSTHCTNGIRSLSAMGAIREGSDSRQSAWKSISGTSMATAHVTGLLAVVRSYLPSLDAKQLHQLLRSQAITSDIGQAGFDTKSGWGEINSQKLMNLMDSSDLNAPSAWASKSELFSAINLTHRISLITRGDINPNSLTASYNDLQLKVSLIDNQIEITTLDKFSEHQIISIKSNSQTLIDINVYPEVSLKIPQFAAHLYLEFGNSGLQTSGLRTVSQQDSWQAITPPLTSGQVIQVSSDIDYDGVYCEMGEFCAYAEYHTDPSLSDVILNGELLGH